jgi:ERCC4-type nuclease
MDSNYERFFLVIHGTIEKYVAMAKNNGRKVTYTRVQNELLGTIARVMSDFECQVFYTPNMSEASLFIVKLHDKLHKPASSHGARAIRRVGLGKETVDNLLEKCGSLEEMCFPDSLKQVKGLGEVLRKRIIQALTSEEPMHVERRKKR